MTVSEAHRTAWARPPVQAQAATPAPQAATPTLTRAAELWLRPARSAPLRIRRIVRDLCAEVGSPASLADDAALLAGEIVAVSLRQLGGPILATVQATAGHVTIYLRDRGEGSPLTETTPAVGRTWDLVRRVAESWGFHVDEDGRRMWLTVRPPWHRAPAVR